MTDEQVQGYNTIRYHIVKNLTDLLVIVLDHDSFGMVTWKHTAYISLHLEPYGRRSYCQVSDLTLAAASLICSIVKIP